jgi:hypothetical protein
LEKSTTDIDIEFVLEEWKESKINGYILFFLNNIKNELKNIYNIILEEKYEKVLGCLITNVLSEVSFFNILDILYIRGIAPLLINKLTEEVAEIIATPIPNAFK